MYVGVRPPKTLGVVLRSLNRAVGGGEPVRFLSKWLFLCLKEGTAVAP